MILLAGFDARSDAISSGDDSLSASNYVWWEASLIFDFFGRAWDKTRAHFQQRRLDRVLRRFPYSLYCSHCGYILKR
jgi:hypothetical protein